MGRDYDVSITPLQRVNVLSPISWRMSIDAEGLQADGTGKLWIEGSYPTWYGAASGMNRLDGHDLAVGVEIVVRLGASSLIRIVRPVRVSVTAVAANRVSLRINLPRGWELQIEDLPPEDAEEQDRPETNR